MSYEDVPERFFICPACGSPDRMASTGGPATCAHCSAVCTLPDRTRLLSAPSAGPTPLPPNDTERLQLLRTQDGRARQPSPNLQAVLGGMTILPGREQEAFAIWQSLRARAANGDVAASEDMATLTLLLTRVPSIMAQPLLVQAVCESTLDAAVLPRHRQEQLGRLCRMAVARGDRAEAGMMLAAMISGGPEIDIDSDYRISAAVVATADRDGGRVLALLGGRKDDIPIVDSLDPMASVFRANAYELLGDPGAAARTLGELPDPQMLDLVRANFPGLELCIRSADGYLTTMRDAASRRARSGASWLGYLVGVILGFVALIQILVWVALGAGTGLGSGVINGAIGLVLGVIAVTVIARARVKGRRAAWLRTNGIPLRAYVTGAQRTGAEVNDIPVYRFGLRVQGPQGPYEASIRKLVPEHQVALLLGQEVQIRADPNDLQKVMLEE